MTRNPPNSANEQSARSRYPGTRPFSDSADDCARFFGRTEEGEQLYLRVLSVPLVVQFGKSGLGKTSLLQASLFPRLRQKPFLPVMVRLNVADETLTLAVAGSIQQACQMKGLELTQGRRDGLWELLSTTTVWRDDLLLTPVLVFDQFEEVFTLRDAAFRADLAAELGALASGIAPERLRSGRASIPEQFATRPDVKIVISLREDYLGALQEFSAAIPSLFHERLRLEPLTEDAARKAITGPAQLMAGAGEEPYWAPRFDFEPPALDSMIAFLKGKSDVIEPFQLQLLCRHAEAIVCAKRSTQNDLIKLAPADFNGSKGFDSVLKNFYRDTLLKLDRSQRSRAETLCEVGLLGTSGHRLMLEERQIHSEFGITKGALTTLSQERLLRRERRLESAFYEISHDRLAESISASRRFRLPKKVRRALWTAGSVALVIMGFLGYLSILRTHQKDEAYSNAAANRALLQLDHDPARSAQLALAALERVGSNQLADFALRQSLARLEVAHTVEIIGPCDLPSESIAGERAYCDPVHDVRYSGDGSQLLVAAGKTVTLFDAKDFRRVGARIERKVNVLQAWLMNGNRTLVTRTDDGKAQIQQLGESVVRPLACPSDNVVWAITPSRDERHVAIGCHEGEVLVWDVAEAAEQPKYTFRRDPENAATVTALDFSADGAFLASGGVDGKVAVWKLGEPGVWVDHVGVGKKSTPLQHSDLAIRDVHFYDQDPNYLVTAGDDKKAIVWKLNLERAPLTKAEQGEPSRWELKHERPVTAAQFSRPLEGEAPPVFTVSGKIAQRWMNETNDSKQMRGHDDWVMDASASPDGKLLVTACADGTARIWSTLSGPPIATLRGHRGRVNRSVFSPKGDAVLTASDDGSVRVWRFRVPEVLAALNHWALGAAFDPQGARVAVADEAGTACVLTLSDHSTCSDSSAKTLMFGHGTLSGLSWSRDAKYLVGIATPNDLGGQSKPMLWKIANEKNSESAALDGALSAVFRVGGDELLTVNEKWRLALWDAKKLEAPDLQPILEFGSDGLVLAIPAISPDGQWIAASNGKDIELWRRGDNQAAPKKLVGHRGAVRSLRFSNDSNRLLSGSEDRTALIWSVESAAKPIELKGGHTGVLYSASFDPTGQWVVTSGADGTIGFWSAETGHQLASLRWHGEAVNSVEFSPDGGRSILSASDDGTVRLGQCEACTLQLAELKARVSKMAKLSRDDERELQRDIGR